MIIKPDRLFISKIIDYWNVDFLPTDYGAVDFLKLSDFLIKAREKVEALKAIGWKDFSVEFERDYDGDYLEQVSIYGRQSEDDEAYNARMKRAEAFIAKKLAKAEADKASKEESERATYERLKKKFES